MPKLLEDKLKQEYPNNLAAVYATMNKIGAMHGNKETPKGRAIEKKMEAEKPAPKKHKMGDRVHGYNWRNRHGQAYAGELK